jgi:hypothetical protein
MQQTRKCKKRNRMQKMQSARTEKYAEKPETCRKYAEKNSETEKMQKQQLQKPEKYAEN